MRKNVQKLADKKSFKEAVEVARGMMFDINWRVALRTMIYEIGYSQVGEGDFEIYNNWVKVLDAIEVLVENNYHSDDYGCIADGIRTRFLLKVEETFGKKVAEQTMYAVKC